MPDRPMTRFDAYSILAALLLGAWWASFAWPMLLWVYQYDLAFALKPLGFWKVVENPVMLRGAVRIGLRMLCLSIAPLTMLVPILRARHPRPRGRSTFAQPGVAACVAASAVILAEIVYYPVWLLTIFGELIRLQGNMRSNITQWPRMHDEATTIGAVAYSVGEHPGLAVMGVFLGCWIAGIRSPGSDWIGRMGRGLGLLWIVCAIGFLLIPIDF